MNTHPRWIHFTHTCDLVGILIRLATQVTIKWSCNNALIRSNTCKWCNLYRTFLKVKAMHDWTVLSTALGEKGAFNAKATQCYGNIYSQGVASVQNIVSWDVTNTHSQATIRQAEWLVEKGKRSHSSLGTLKVLAHLEYRTAFPIGFVLLIWAVKYWCADEIWRVCSSSERRNQASKREHLAIIAIKNRQVLLCEKAWQYGLHRKLTTGSRFNQDWWNAIVLRDVVFKYAPFRCFCTTLYSRHMLSNSLLPSLTRYNGPHFKILYVPDAVDLRYGGRARPMSPWP